MLVAFAIGSAAGVVFLKDDEVGIGDSHGAEKVLAREFPTERAGEEVLIQSRGGRLQRAELRAAVDDLTARLSRVPAVAAIESPLDAGNGGQLSSDGRSALVTFQITGDPDTAPDRVDAALAATAAVQRAHPNLLIGEVGDASINKAMSDRLAKDFQQAEVTSLPVTLVILVLAFGALVAAGIPLLLGLTAVMGALGLTALFSHLLHVDESINSVILLIGLAVGVDYSLFYLRRYREERARGRSPAAALEIAAATSGRAVLVSGLTVMAAMAGMLLMGTRVFQGFGVGTILVVAIALVGSLTVLPAVISKLGDRIDRGRIPFLRRLVARDGESRFWGKIVGGVLRRPVVWGVLAATLLVALAIPAFRLHTANSGAQGLPADLPIVTRLRPRAGGVPRQAAAGDRRRQRARRDRAGRSRRGSMRSSAPRSRPARCTSRSASTSAPRAAPPACWSRSSGNGTDEASNRALDALRGSVIPSTIGRVPGAEAHVTGATAISRDFNDSMKSHAPIVFAWVLGLAFVLLLVTFRSIVIPIKAIVLNMLSVGAAYGVLVLIFQDGRLAVAAQLPVVRRRDVLAAAVPLRRPLRTVDGLPRPDPQPRARGLRRRHADRASRRARHPRDGERRHQRGDRDGRRVRDLRHARLDRLQDDGRRPGRRRAPGRHDRPRRAAPGDHGAARRLELVPPALAGMAATDQPRATRDTDPYRA